jgi:YD repeat-containing protein
MRKHATLSRNRILRPLLLEILENRSSPTDVRSLGSALPQLVPSLANYTYGYDNANRVTSTTAPEGNSTFTYDDRNQLTGVTGWHPEGYNYDPNGNRNTNGNTPGAGNRQQSDGTYSYVYDNEGNVITQTYTAAGLQNGWTWTYTWDYRNRLTEAVVKNAQGVTQYDDRFVYDAND